MRKVKLEGKGDWFWTGAAQGSGHAKVPPGPLLLGRRGQVRMDSRLRCLRACRRGAFVAAPEASGWEEAEWRGRRTSPARCELEC